MARDHLLYLEDIVESARKIRRYVAGMTLESFSANDLVIDAVLRNLEVIGEACKHVPEDIKERHPEVAWRGMAGLRDVIIHRYFGLHLETLWDIVDREIPMVEGQVQAIVEREQ
jgi:uncharacterized protein with HEPN domain